MHALCSKALQRSLRKKILKNNQLKPLKTTFNQDPRKTDALGRSFTCSLNNAVDVGFSVYGEKFTGLIYTKHSTGAENSLRININYSKHLERNIKTNTLFRPQTS